MTAKVCNLLVVVFLLEVPSSLNASAQQKEQGTEALQRILAEQKSLRTKQDYVGHVGEARRVVEVPANGLQTFLVQIWSAGSKKLQKESISVANIKTNFSTLHQLVNASVMISAYLQQIVTNRAYSGIQCIHNVVSLLDQSAEAHAQVLKSLQNHTLCTVGDKCYRRTNGTKLLAQKHCRGISGQLPQLQEQVSDCFAIGSDVQSIDPTDPVKGNAVLRNSVTLPLSYLVVAAESTISGACGLLGIEGSSKEKLATLRKQLVDSFFVDNEIISATAIAESTTSPSITMLLTTAKDVVPDEVGVPAIIPVLCPSDAVGDGGVWPSHETIKWLLEDAIEHSLRQNILDVSMLAPKFLASLCLTFRGFHWRVTVVPKVHKSLAERPFSAFNSYLDCSETDESAESGLTSQWHRRINVAGGTADVSAYWISRAANISPCAKRLDNYAMSPTSSAEFLEALVSIQTSAPPTNSCRLLGTWLRRLCDDEDHHSRVWLSALLQETNENTAIAVSAGQSVFTVEGLCSSGLPQRLTLFAGSKLAAYDYSVAIVNITRSSENCSSHEEPQQHRILRLFQQTYAWQNIYVDTAHLLIKCTELSNVVSFIVSSNASSSEADYAHAKKFADHCQRVFGDVEMLLRNTADTFTPFFELGPTNDAASLKAKAEEAYRRINSGVPRKPGVFFTRVENTVKVIIAEETESLPIGLTAKLGLCQQQYKDIANAWLDNILLARSAIREVIEDGATFASDETGQQATGLVWYFKLFEMTLGGFRAAGTDRKVSSFEIALRKSSADVSNSSNNCKAIHKDYNRARTAVANLTDALEGAFTGWQADSVDFSKYRTKLAESARLGAVNISLVDSGREAFKPDQKAPTRKWTQSLPPSSYARTTEIAITPALVHQSDASISSSSDLQETSTSQIFQTDQPEIFIKTTGQSGVTDGIDGQINQTTITDARAALGSLSFDLENLQFNISMINLGSRAPWISLAAFSYNCLSVFAKLENFDIISPRRQSVLFKRPDFAHAVKQVTEEALALYGRVENIMLGVRGQMNSINNTREKAVALIYESGLESGVWLNPVLETIQDRLSVSTNESAELIQSAVKHSELLRELFDLVALAKDAPSHITKEAQVTRDDFVLRITKNAVVENAYNDDVGAVSREAVSTRQDYLDSTTGFTAPWRLLGIDFVRSANVISDSMFPWHRMFDKSSTGDINAGVLGKHAAAAGRFLYASSIMLESSGFSNVVMFRISLQKIADILRLLGEKHTSTATWPRTSSLVARMKSLGTNQSLNGRELLAEINSLIGETKAIEHAGIFRNQEPFVHNLYTVREGRTRFSALSERIVALMLVAHTEVLEKRSATYFTQHDHELDAAKSLVNIAVGSTASSPSTEQILRTLASAIASIEAVVDLFSDLKHFLMHMSTIARVQFKPDLESATFISRALTAKMLVNESRTVRLSAVAPIFVNVNRLANWALYVVQTAESYRIVSLSHSMPYLRNASQIETKREEDMPGILAYFRNLANSIFADHAGAFNKHNAYFRTVLHNL